MVERFFSVPQIDFHPQNQHQQLQPQILLLSGPSSSGKSSLLFQFAFNSALHTRAQSSTTAASVVFLCNRRKLESNPPFLSQGIDPSSEVFQRIQMKYVDDDEGIKNYFAAFHLQHHTFPVSVIVDDFADFFDERNCQNKYTNPRGRDLAMVRVLALCRNAIAHANEAGPCRLLLSDTHHGDSPRLLYIYKRWVSSIYTIKGDGFGSFLLKNSYQSGIGNSAGKGMAKYSIALQYLVLEGITEDEDSKCTSELLYLRLFVGQPWIELHFRIHLNITSFSSKGLTSFCWKNTGNKNIEDLLNRRY